MYTNASLSSFSCMFLFVVSYNGTKQMCNSSYQLSYFLWYIALTAFFLLHDSHHALLSITYFEKTVKSSALSILSLCAIFFMFKVRGSSMKRGSFNKKRSVKRKSTKVCVLIISEGPFVVCLTIITLPLITATLPDDDVWTFDIHWCINQFILLQSVTVPLRTILF